MDFDFQPNDVDPSLPLVYLWTLTFPNGTLQQYVGKAKGGAKRPLTHYARNIRRMSLGLPYRRSKPNGWRAVHLAMAQCLAEGGTLSLSLLENVPLEALNAAERRYISAFSPELNG